MTRPAYSILYSASVASTAANGGAGDVLIQDSTGAFVLATTAARAGRRSTGIALGTYIAGGVVDIGQNGQYDATTANLGAGTASSVRVSTSGGLERATVSGSDDVVGFVETDGTFHALFGILTAAIVNGAGSGFTPPTGTGFVTVTSGSLDAASLAAPAGALVGTSATQTLTAKSIDAATNTITNLTQSSSKAAQAIAALAIDWNAGNVFTKTLSAGGNTFTWANAAGGKTIVVRLTGAASTVTWPAVPTLKWAGGSVPVQTTSGTDVYTFVHDGTGIYGSVVQAFA